MHNISSCKINRTDGCKESSLSPYHMCHRIIYDNRPECDKRKQCLEFHSSNNCTGDQCRCDHRKHHLKCSVYKMRDTVGIRTGIPADAVQCEPVKTSDDTAVVASERK